MRYFNGVRKLISRAVSLIFPRRCAICGRVTGSAAVCPTCETALPVVKPPVCRVCGREKKYCVCGNRRFAFDRCVTPFYYEDGAKKGVLRLKFGGKTDAASVFAAYAADIVQKEYAGIPFDFITAVPLARREAKKRGFNQSEELARALSKKLGIKYCNALRKPMDIKPQRRCSASERWENVAGAFEAEGQAAGKTVLLVDDIITTGATLHECAKALKQAGAAGVYCAAIACVKKNADFDMGKAPKNLNSDKYAKNI